jgi:hypothetical protein
MPLKPNYSNNLTDDNTAMASNGQQIKQKGRNPTGNSLKIFID